MIKSICQTGAFYLALLIIVSAAIPTALADKPLLYAFFTASRSENVSGSIAAAVELAEQEILKEPSILEGYILRHTSIEDTLVSLLLTA